MNSVRSGAVAEEVRAWADRFLYLSQRYEVDREIETLPIEITFATLYATAAVVVVVAQQVHSWQRDSGALYHRQAVRLR